MTKLVFILVIMICSFTSRAEIYKWTDSDGTIHYDDKPSLKNKKQLMDIHEENNSVKTLTNDRAENRRKLIETMDEDRKLKKEAAAKAKKKKEKLAKRCLNAKDSLKSYLRSSYVYNLDKDGNRVALPSSARDASIANIKKRIAANCK